MDDSPALSTQINQALNSLPQYVYLFDQHSTGSLVPCGHVMFYRPSLFIHTFILALKPNLA